LISFTLFKISEHFYIPFLLGFRFPSRILDPLSDTGTGFADERQAMCSDCIDGVSPSNYGWNVGWQGIYQKELFCLHIMDCGFIIFTVLSNTDLRNPVSLQFLIKFYRGTQVFHSNQGSTANFYIDGDRYTLPNGKMF